jgi:hypothetical protein
MVRSAFGVASGYRWCGCESALGKPNLLIDPFSTSGSHLLVPKIEGLIHTARCPTDKLTALLAPADGGLDWPGGLSSPVMDTSTLFLKSREQRYSHSSPAPLEWG